MFKDDPKKFMKKMADEGVILEDTPSQCFSSIEPDVTALKKWLLYDRN
jgi:hypothetical protein